MSDFIIYYDILANDCISAVYRELPESPGYFSIVITTKDPENIGSLADPEVLQAHLRKVSRWDDIRLSDVRYQTLWR